MMMNSNRAWVGIVTFNPMEKFKLALFRTGLKQKSPVAGLFWSIE